MTLPASRAVSKYNSIFLHFCDGFRMFYQFRRDRNWKSKFRFRVDLVLTEWSLINFYSQLHTLVMYVQWQSLSTYLSVLSSELINLQIS
jgi:hypothetical protein